MSWEPLAAIAWCDGLLAWVYRAICYWTIHHQTVNHHHTHTADLDGRHWVMVTAIFLMVDCLQS